MKIIIIVLAVFAVAFLMGRLNLYIRFNRQVNALFTQSKNISAKKFSYSQLAALPVPVQQYFMHVLKDGQHYVSYARLKHNGQFKTGADKNWVDIQGEQYIAASKPAFVWKGITSMFTAYDMFIEDKGRLMVTLLSVYNIVDGEGESFNQGELLRWLGESVWLPTNLLPNAYLSWTPVNTHAARLTFNYNGLILYYMVTFNDAGEIVELETKRYMDATHLETWIVRLSNYKTMNGILVPTKTEALWRLKTGDLSYAKFNVTQLEYDKKERF